MGRTVAIIQGRMGSSRLPGKILLDIAGEPMLMRVVGRVRRAKTVDEVVFATTTERSDDPVAEFCQTHAIALWRGSLPDVLDRFYQAARYYHAETVVRITADCPLLDPGLVDETVALFSAQGADFATNRLPPPYQRTYPIGLDCEVCTFAALERAWQEATAPYEREHVMPYLYDVEGRFKTVVLDYRVNYGSLRWTVDTEEDLELVRQIYLRLSSNPDFTWLDVLAIVEREPDLAKLNARVKHRTMYDVDVRYSKGHSK
jgi:spore coat polysaccharide biosynthesis protein SpsF